MKRKLMYLDTETTGLDPKKNSIIQLSGIIINSELEKTEEFNFNMQPVVNDEKEIESIALEKNNISEDSLWERPPATVAFDQFIKLLDSHINRYDNKDKFLSIGYNVRFDLNMIRAWFDDMNHKYFGSYFFNAHVDVYSIASLAYSKELYKFKNFRLETLCKTLGLVEEDDNTSFHDAMFDVKATKKLLDHSLIKLKENLL